jgi:hypothetical protein
MDVFFILFVDYNNTWSIAPPTVVSVSCGAELGVKRAYHHRRPDVEKMAGAG